MPPVEGAALLARSYSGKKGVIASRRAAPSEAMVAAASQRAAPLGAEGKRSLSAHSRNGSVRA